MCECLASCKAGVFWPGDCGERDDRILETSSENGGYRGCAVYLEHTHNPNETVARNHSSVMSIKDLEAKTGVNFFVNLPAAIGAEAAAAVEAENPNSVSWWWN